MTVGNLLNLSGPRLAFFLKNEWVGPKIPLITEILLFYMVSHSTKFPLRPELVCDFLARVSPSPSLIVKPNMNKKQ